MTSKLSEFAVKIVDNRRVFKPGDEIAFVVNLKVTEPIKIRGIHLKVCGQCYVYWEETRSSGDNSRHKIHYKGEDNFITERKVLWGEEGDSPVEELLPAGEYTFTEQYILPNNIPSSYEGKYGNVRYWAKAKIYRTGWKFHVTSEEAHFSIDSVYDLNEYPEAQKTTFRADNNVISNKVIIAEASHDSIEPGGTDVWHDPIIIPPETHPTNLGASTIIEIGYEMQFYLQAEGCNCDDIKFKEKIILGTIPLNTTLTSSLNTAIEDCSQRTPLMPPPSYAECMTPGSPHFVKQDSLPSYSDIQSFPLQQEMSRN